MEALKFKAWVCTLRVALLPSCCCTKRILLPPPLDPHICIWFFALCFALALKIQNPSADQSYWVLLTRARRSSTTQRQRDLVVGGLRKMHDFCFTYPYGFLVLIGGLLGFLRKGSTTSLMGGVGSGLLLLLAGYQSHQAFLKGSKSPAALFLETGVSLCPLQNLLLPPFSILI